MNLVNLTYQMQFTVIFLNNNDNTTNRMNIDLRPNHEKLNIQYNNRPPIKSRRKHTNGIRALNNLYNHIKNTLRMSKNGFDYTADEFNLKYMTHLKIIQRRKFSNKSNKRTRRNGWRSIQHQRSRSEDKIDKLIKQFQRKNISQLEREDIDIVDVKLLKGSGRNKRALSILVRELGESEMDLAGMPNQLVPKYHEYRNRKKAIEEYGKKYANMTSRNTDEELHFLNFTELKEEIEHEREKLSK